MFGGLAGGGGALFYPDNHEMSGLGILLGTGIGIALGGVVGLLGS